MINPVTVMKVLSERKAFLENHPELFKFLKESFGGEVKRGTKINVEVTETNGERNTLTIEVKESDLAFLDSLKELF